MTAPAEPDAEAERAEILAGLQALAADLTMLEAARTAMYGRRLDLWLRGRALARPLTQRQLAEASGITEPAVIQALKKARTQETTTDA